MNCLAFDDFVGLCVVQAYNRSRRAATPPMHGPRSDRCGLRAAFVLSAELAMVSVDELRYPFITEPGTRISDEFPI